MSSPSTVFRRRALVTAPAGATVRCGEGAGVGEGDGEGGSGDLREPPKLPSATFGFLRGSWRFCTGWAVPYFAFRTSAERCPSAARAARHSRFSVSIDSIFGLRIRPSTTSMPPSFPAAGFRSGSSSAISSGVNSPTSSASASGSAGRSLCASCSASSSSRYSSHSSRRPRRFARALIELPRRSPTNTLMTCCFLAAFIPWGSPEARATSTTHRPRTGPVASPGASGAALRPSWRSSGRGGPT